MSTEPASPGSEGEPGLKQNALGFVDALVIGLASTAPATNFSHRHELTRSARSFLFIGVAPLAGAVILGYLLVRSVMDLSDPEASYSGSAVLGVGVPLVIGAAFLLLGAILMVAWRIAGLRGYFDRRGFEALPRDFVPGAAAEELAEVPAGRS